MTPYDSTRCAELCEDLGCSIACVNYRPTPTLATGEGVYRYDYLYEVLLGAVSEFRRQAQYDAGSSAFYAQYLEEAAKEFAALREQVATLTAELAHQRQVAEDAEVRLMAMNAELAAVRAPVPSGVTEAMVVGVIGAMLSEGFEDCSAGYALKVARDRLTAALRGGPNAAD